MEVVQSSFFECINPMASNVLTIKNPAINNGMLHSELLKVTVVDSTSAAQPPIAAILMVPRGREHDVLFCEKDGHLQLLEKFFNVSRLIIVANVRDAEPEVRYNLVQVTDVDKRDAKRCLKGPLKPLDPWSSETRFVAYDDGLVSRTKVAVGRGDVHVDMGPFTVTDEVIQIGDKYELRRRLRFRKTVDVIHAEIRLRNGEVIFSEDPAEFSKQDVDYKQNLADILEPYWKAIKFGISIAFFDGGKPPKIVKPPKDEEPSKQKWLPSLLQKEVQPKKVVFQPKKAVCFGAIGGAGYHYLTKVCGFQVIMFDNEPVDDYLNPMMEVFGVPKGSITTNRLKPMQLLNTYDTASPEPNTSLEPHVVKLIEEFHKKAYGRFDLLLIDMTDCKLGVCSAPPNEMMTMDALNKMKKVVAEDGVVMIHFMPHDYTCYVDMIVNITKVFSKVIKIQVSKKSCILVAMASDSAGVSSSHGGGGGGGVAASYAVNLDMFREEFTPEM